MQKDRFFCRKCLTSRFRTIPIGVFLEALRNAYLILLREVCWNRCRRHRFQLSLAHYFPGGAPLPQSVETCTAIVLTVDTFWGSPTLNLEGWGGFKLVGVLSLKSLWILFKTSLTWCSLLDFVVLNFKLTWILLDGGRGSRSETCKTVKIEPWQWLNLSAKGQIFLQKMSDLKI